MHGCAEVHVDVEGAMVPGLVLKWNSVRDRALVTFENAGAVRTHWVPSANVFFDVGI